MSPDSNGESGRSTTGRIALTHQMYKVSCVASLTRCGRGLDQVEGEDHHERDDHESGHDARSNPVEPLQSLLRLGLHTVCQARPSPLPMGCLSALMCGFLASAGSTPRATRWSMLTVWAPFVDRKAVAE